MIRLFKYSGPLQLGVLFILIMTLKTPLFFSGPPLLSEDLKHMVVGERMSEGYLMYRDIVDETPPIPAFLYWILAELFGRSMGAYFLLSGLLVFLQAILFRMMINKNEVFYEKGDIPALMYAIGIFICFDFLSLTPSLIALTFVLPAFNGMFRHIKSGINEGDMFATGLFFGLSFLSHQAAILFFFCAFFSILISKKTSLKYFMLLIVGFFFPVIGIATFFFLADGFNQFFNYFLVNFNLLVPQTYEVDLKTILIIIAPTVFFNIIGVMVALGYRRYIIYQIISQRILVISYLVILVGLMLMFKSPAENFLLLLPFVAYFNTHFFMIFGKGGFGGFVLALYLGYSLRIIYSYLPVPYLEADFLNYNNQFIVKNDWNQKFENKRIAVFGENIAIFLNNKLSTPYLDWDLSKHILLNADHYAEVIRLFGDLKSDMPEVIVDENRVMPELMQHVPLLQKKYVLSPGENQIYIKR